MTNHVDLALRLFLLAWIARDEFRRARWLPWWRRYLAVLLMLPFVANAFAVFGPRNGASDWALMVVALAMDTWNMLSANRNKRNGNDRKKAEAAEAERLTEVQQTAFQREATEAA